MVSRVKTLAFSGIEALSVDVQVQVLPDGKQEIAIVGLPDKTVGESRERIRACFHAIGLSLPYSRISVNLAPADVMKEGTHYDLPIALGILMEIGVIKELDLSSYLAIGELGLDGTLAPISGVLPAAIFAVENGLGLICPEICGPEAAWGGDLQILAPLNIVHLMNHFRGTQVLTQPIPALSDPHSSKLNLKDIKGQESAKRALEIAAAGGHNMLMIGPPGSGKSMLASRLPGILPPLEPKEALEVTMIHSISGKLQDGKLIRARPFRDPHHSSSLPALVGGGARSQPGEISLAHQGVLFLDELPEFKRSTLESLRQPLESGRVTIARANSHITYPARFQLIAAMNPCKCGYLDDTARSCGRAPKCSVDYQGRISGPIFDRIDLHIEVPEVCVSKINEPGNGESSHIIAARVMAARVMQNSRSGGLNSLADGESLEEILHLDQEAKSLLGNVIKKIKFSARGYTRLLRVSRTIADLEQSDSITKAHVSEAISYRRLYFK
jgi:magnesium chelatase family protein